MKDFNGYKMTGLTNDDNKAIINAINQQIGLKIDNLGRIWNEGGHYIADAEEVEPGFGILCNNPILNANGEPLQYDKGIIEFSR